MGRCSRVLPEAIGDAGGKGGGANVSAAFGSTVGVCVPRWEPGPLVPLARQPSQLPRNWERRSCWATMRGSTTNAGRQPHAVGAEASQARGDCTTCTATCGSGARTGTTRITMRSRLRMIRRDLRRATFRDNRGGGWDCNPGTAGRRTVPRVRAQLRQPNMGFRVSLVLPDKTAEQTTIPDEPIVPAKPVPLDLKPDAKAWDLKPGSPLNPASLVLKPAAIKGLRSWTLEICASRIDCGGLARGRSTQPGRQVVCHGRP